MQRTFNFFYAFLLAILGFGATLIAEDITLTTYYPAPYGVYDELRSGKVGINLLTTDIIQNKLDVEGNVAIGAGYSGTNAAPTNGLIVQGQVGIGTASPTVGTALDVNGTVNATTYSAGGTAPVADGTYTVGKGTTQDGRITVKGGIITVIQQAAN